MADAQETITESLTACTLGGEESAGAPVSRKMVPETYHPGVIRTDFSDQQPWEAIVTAIRAPYPEGVEARVHFLDDPAFQGLTATQLQDLIPKKYTSVQAFLMVVDHVTISEPEHPIVIVNVNEFDDSDWHGRQFRFVPAALTSRTLCGILPRSSKKLLWPSTKTAYFGLFVMSRPQMTQNCRHSDRSILVRHEGYQCVSVGTWRSSCEWITLRSHAKLQSWRWT